jgi:rubrerythrin
VPPVNDASVQKVAALLQEDVDNYGSVRDVADAVADRGAARVCVWGEKVTRMLSSLVNRYINEGESMLADATIWICTVCGFVYIGENAPEQCPVCKVPAWKFEKIEGRIG